MTIRLEVGNKYLTRDGRVAEVIGIIANEFLPVGENNYRVRIGGNQHEEYFICKDGFAQPLNILGGRKEASEDLVSEVE